MWLFPFGISDIPLITINGMLFNVQTCAIAAPSISTQSALKSNLMLSFLLTSVKNISPVAIVPKQALNLSSKF